MIYQQLPDFGARFAMIDETDVVKSDVAKHIEDSLQVSLPADFGRICEFLDGCDAGLGSGARGATLIEQGMFVGLTLELRRNLGLPLPYVALGANDEAILLLACSGAPHEKDSVHLIPRVGLARFSVGVRPGNSRSWPTFVDYFAEALESDTDPSWR